MMRIMVLFLMVFALAIAASAQGVTPTFQQQVTPTPTLIATIAPQVPAQAQVTPAPGTDFGLPIYLSGVGATPLQRDVNIRFGPGVEYRIIGALRLGKSIDVVGYNGYDLGRTCDTDFSTTLDMWIAVQFNERRGWIARCAVVVTGDMSRMLVQPAP
jgi:hypothetical protein